MTNKKSNGGGHFILGAFFGAIAGAAAGILTAPKSGKETQADLAREGKKFAKKAETTAKKAGLVETKKPAKTTTKKSTTKKPSTK